MHTENAQPRCPECGYSWQGLPSAGLCPECGYKYEGLTDIWRPPKWAFAVCCVGFLLQAVGNGLGYYTELHPTVPAGFTMFGGGVAPGLLIKWNLVYARAGLFIGCVAVAVYCLLAIVRTRYVSADDWGIHVHLSSKPREAEWASIRAIGRGGLFVDWVLLHNGRRIRISRPLYNRQYSAFIKRAKARLAEFQAQQQTAPDDKPPQPPAVAPVCPPESSS